MLAATNAAPARAIASRRGSPAVSASNSARIANVVPRIEWTIDRPTAADQQVSRRSFCSGGSSARRATASGTGSRRRARGARTASAARRRGSPPTETDLGEQLARDLEALDRCSPREQALGGTTAQIALLERIQLADTRRLEIRVPGFVRVAGVRQRLGTRDEQRALAGFVAAAEPQRHREPAPRR